MDTTKTIDNRFVKKIYSAYLWCRKTNKSRLHCECSIITLYLSSLPSNLFQLCNEILILYFNLQLFYPRVFTPRQHILLGFWSFSPHKEAIFLKVTHAQLFYCVKVLIAGNGKKIVDIYTCVTLTKNGRQMRPLIFFEFLFVSLKNKAFYGK